MPKRRTVKQLGKDVALSMGGAVSLALAAVIGFAALGPAKAPPLDRPVAAPIMPVNNTAKRDPEAVELERRLAKDIQPLINKYCYACHGNGKKKGGVKLDGPGGIDDIMNMADDWITVVDVMTTKLMPPEDQPQPTAAEIVKIQEWVTAATEYYPADAEPDPGWFTIHRLNHSEYRNTLRDLLGIDPAEHDLAEDLPSDDSGYGFDNIADVLSMSPLQLEKYLDAAERAIELGLGPSADPEPKRLGQLKRSNVGEELDGGAQAIWANGSISGEYTFPHDGTYKVIVQAWGDLANRKGPRIALSVGVDRLGEFDVTATRPRRAQTFEQTFEVKAGKQSVAVHFINDAVIDREDRNLYVKSIAVLGPLVENDRGVYDRVFFVQPTADDRGKRLPGVEGGRRITETQAARMIIERFATQAFRRQADKGEVAALLRLYSGAREAGDHFEDAVKLALTATLVSPNFLYRSINNPQANDPDHVYTLTDDELASRLSYFLWSSMPDERLLDLARDKKLRDPRVLREQVARMLMDPKSDALVENFAGQWLLLRKLDGLEMDPSKFPDFDAKLRESMRTEAQLYFADVLRENRSVLELLDSDRAFLNERLAEHYGIRGVRGERFRAVKLPADSPRGGVLTMGATLTVTSEATRTSPVKRGDYVLSQLLGTPPPPPPPDVPPLDIATEEVGDTASLREQLAAHVANPDCAGCHKRLDPIGLAMENFDATGAWREMDAGQPIDASGELPGGILFDGPVQLKQVMLDRRDLFVQNLTRTMLIYATGRGAEPFDRPTIQKVAQSVKDDGYRMQTLIESIVLSDAFLKARGRETQP